MNHVRKTPDSVFLILSLLHKLSAKLFYFPDPGYLLFLYIGFRYGCYLEVMVLFLVWWAAAAAHSRLRVGRRGSGVAVVAMLG